MTPYLIGIICGVLAMLGWGIGEATAKLAVAKTSEFVSYFWVEVVVASVFVLVGIARGAHLLLIGPYVLTFALVIAGTYTLAYIFSYRAYRVGKLAIVSPILCSYGMLSSLLAAIFLHQQVTPLQLIAISLIIGATIALSLDIPALRQGDLKMTRGVKEALVAFVFFGVNSVFLDYISERADIHLLNMLISLLSLMLVAAYLLVRNVSVRLTKVDRTGKLYLLATGILTLGANYFFIYGYSVGDSIVIAPLGAASGTVTALISLIFFREKLTKLQLLAVATSLAGIILLSLG